MMPLLPPLIRRRRRVSLSISTMMFFTYAAPLRYFRRHVDVCRLLMVIITLDDFQILLLMLMPSPLRLLMPLFISFHARPPLFFAR